MQHTKYLGFLLSRLSAVAGLPCSPQLQGNVLVHELATIGLTLTFLIKMTQQQLGAEPAQATTTVQSAAQQKLNSASVRLVQKEKTQSQIRLSFKTSLLA